MSKEPLCPYCGGQTKFGMKVKSFFCTRCCRVLDGNSQSRKSVVENVEESHEKYVLGTIGAMVVLAALFFGYITLTDTPNSNKPNEAATEEDRRSDAARMCQKSVSAKLLSPSMAKFPSIYHLKSFYKLYTTGENLYRVESYVDAPNAYGVFLRMRWRCDAKYVGNDEWMVRSQILQ